MPYVVRAFPLIRPVVELQSFLSALSGARRADADKFYRQYGVSHESVYMQESPQGHLLIVVTIIEDQHQASPRFKAASEEFQTWFKAQLLHLTGVDANVTPLGPPTTEVFAWSAASAELCIPARVCSMALRVLTMRSTGLAGTCVLSSCIGGGGPVSLVVRP